ESHCVIITSTWGDGDPPDNAAQAWAWLNSDAAPRLEHLNFAVLGLGDENYAEFCGAAKKFDARLEALGAKRLVPRSDCGVDYEQPATSWMTALWDALATTPNTAANTPAKALAVEAEKSVPGYSRAAPFSARLKTNRRLNGPGSDKETRHFEILLGPSGPTYEPGDALGVIPENCPVLVEELLACLACSGEEKVNGPDGKEITLHEALLKHHTITQPTPSLVQAAAERSKHTELLGLIAPDQKGALDKWLFGRDIVDVLRGCAGAAFEPAEFTGLLRKLQPRLYSISSSPRAHPGEVHLTIAAVRYKAQGREKKGVASCWLADRCSLNEGEVRVFVQKSHGFRLPTDMSRPIIMAGPGTGIAPFRAFLEERRAAGATGKNWLFFGDQQRAHDFLYEEELTAMVDDGHLTRLDLAFSRDQEEKIYVQNRMMEHASELWRWLEAGAHFYVCGDAKRMARDVDTALHDAIVKAGGKTSEQAAEYVAKLKTEKRYQRDVY
ncbi:MAG TPA: sulfite reductase subunit alpha, partial [Candidatus Saccharimonadales bacterium]|nr:sulfite reductase subunit alpha [Candidatus Saccharimonadales bacterium]